MLEMEHDLDNKPLTMKKPLTHSLQPRDRRPRGRRSVELDAFWDNPVDEHCRLSHPELVVTILSVEPLTRKCFGHELGELLGRLRLHSMDMAHRSVHECNVRLTSTELPPPRQCELYLDQTAVSA